METLEIIDNDKDEISITRGGKEIRAWSYSHRQEQFWKMQMAHEFVEGWYQAGRHKPTPPSGLAIDEATVERVRGALNDAHKILWPWLDKYREGGPRLTAEEWLTICDKITNARAALAAIPQGGGWKCKSQPTADPPQDCGYCGWPTCGCDPYADKVINALDEMGAFAPPPSQGSET